MKVAQSIKSKIFKKPHLLSKHPEIGQKEDNLTVVNRGFRYLVEGNFKIVYKIYHEDKNILVSTVFDTRQNPEKFKV